MKGPLHSNCSEMDISNLIPDNSGPLLFTPKSKDFDPFRWLAENMLTLDECILKYGGVLLRNFNISSVSEFNRFVHKVSPNLLEYVNRSTPRTRLGGKIYTSTEYPPEKQISMHNECSYSNSWPSKIFFYSSIVASSGGQTPIADSRAVYKKIDQKIREKFEEHGVMYIRNYSKGTDLRWEDVFQTDKKNEVEEYCKKEGIEYQWKDGFPELTTKQVCKATLTHPISKELVWFNQAHLYHVSSLDEISKNSLINEFGINNIPRNAFYGNGETIEGEVLEHIRDVYSQEKITFDWEHGDILILDNLLMAHGREPYQGERKVAVAMS
ncbi:MAG: hypothetical protein BGO67_10225 [Alphaproteobacteria bacterium 41-28]|nr:MAG: hypothetical protein BGO67_10225 [Alphaproteobacteria bacterium 41-28]